MARNPSLNDYIENSDLEGVYARYQSARSNWQAHWWEGVVRIFHSSVKFAKMYILDPVNRILRKISGTLTEAKSTLATRAKVPIIEKQNFAKYAGQKQCYLFKFYDSDKNIIFSKIGTTKRGYLQRLKEEIRDYRKNGFDVAYATVDDIFGCGGVVPEGFESFVRAKLIKLFPNTWKRNDRYMNIDIPVEDFRSACMEYARL